MFFNFFVTFLNRWRKSLSTKKEFPVRDLQPFFRTEQKRENFSGDAANDDDDDDDDDHSRLADY